MTALVLAFIMLGIGAFLNPSANGILDGLFMAKAEAVTYTDVIERYIFRYRNRNQSLLLVADIHRWW